MQPFHDLFQSNLETQPVGTSTTAMGGGAQFPRQTGAAAKTYYRNADLYRLLRPDGTSLPYVYDNFVWPHCEVSLREGREDENSGDDRGAGSCNYAGLQSRCFVKLFAERQRARKIFTRTTYQYQCKTNNSLY